jgi:hypothetical protein
MTTPSRSPIVNPNLTSDAVAEAAKDTATAAAPFLPKRARAVIYGVAGAIGLAAPSVGIVLGGQLGDGLIVIGAAATAITGVTALSHVSGS